MFLLLMDVLIEDVRKGVPGSMIFADEENNVLRGNDETHCVEMTRHTAWRHVEEHCTTGSEDQIENPNHRL